MSEAINISSVFRILKQTVVVQGDRKESVVIGLRLPLRHMKKSGKIEDGFFVSIVIPAKAADVRTAMSQAKLALSDYFEIDGPFKRAEDAS